MKKLRNVIAIFAFAMCFMWAGIGECFAFTLAELQANSTKLTYGQAVTGTIVEDEEVDTYKFTVSQTGYFQLSFLLTENSCDELGDGWNVKIYSANDLVNCIREYEYIQADMKTGKMALAEGDYFVFVEEQDSRWNPTNDSEYAVKADFVEDLSWEIEGNNDNRVATAIALNKQYKGVHTVTSDVDWYKFTTTQAGKFSVTFSVDNATNIDDIKAGWKLVIYDSEFKELKTYSDITAAITTVELPFEKGNFYAKVEMQDARWDPCLDCVYGIKVNYASTVRWESEYNDVNTKAEVIKVNELWKGSSFSSEDVDWYKFVTAADGKFSVSFTIDQLNDINNLGAGWKFTIYDSTFNELKVYSDIVLGFTTVELPFAKGTYYVKVEMQDGRWNPCMDCVYGIKVNYTTPARWESEYNDKSTQADTIKVNEIWNGLSYKSDDIDWYKFTTTKAGYFQVELGVPANIDNEKIGAGWCMVVYDKDFNVIKQVNDIKSNTKTIILPYGKGTFYVEVKMQDGRWNPCLDCNYTLKVINKATTSYESENNDTMKKADSITLGKLYNGVTNNVDDQDWYKFKVTKNGTVKFEIKKHSSSSAEEVKNGWYGIVYDADNNEVGKINNAKSKGSATINLKKGTYYVKVGVQDRWKAPTECSYTISTKFAPAPSSSKITSIKSKAKKVTLKWKKSTKANGYYIYRAESKKGKYKKIATVKGAKKVSYTDKKGLKKGKKYYYKVVAYKTTNKINAVAKEGNIKVVKVR